MSAKNFLPILDLKYLRKIKKKKFKKFQKFLKIFQNFLKKFQNFVYLKKLLALIKFFIFFISSPKCIELNSEFVRPKKNLGFGFGSRSKTHVFFGSYVCTYYNIFLGLGLGPDPKPEPKPKPKTHRDPSQNV